jgi:predicted alpha/beta-hydrolase family hydrolase
MLIDGPANARAMIILAHGAGAPMDTPYMTTIAEGLARAELRVVRFEFDYMAKRRIDGKRRGPDRMPVLLSRWDAVLAELGTSGRPALIGGKSMGGRSAATYAAQPEHQGRIAGVVCLGYPFHPPGKPEKTRLEPLRTATSPVLIVQGERDPFGKPGEISGYDLQEPVSVSWIPDGDHSFVPRKRSGHSEAANLDLAVQIVSAFVDSRLQDR